MGTLYIDTGGSATNSGTSDTNAAQVSGTAATVAAGVVSLDGSPDLSFLSGRTSGATQAAIHINDATNSNQKIFWIDAYDDILKTVTPSVAPTGVVSSSWAIDGRFVWTPASIEAAMRAGDTRIWNNSPASSATDMITTRTSGDSTSGPIKDVGKSGTRPVLTVTTTANCVDGGAGTQNGCYFENLELDQDGASGNACKSMGPGATFYNVKISDAGGIGFETATGLMKVIASEVSGTGDDGVRSTSGTLVFGNYLHDLTGDGFEASVANVNQFCSKNIVDTCAGRGVYFSGAPTSYAALYYIEGNTVYGCGNTGLEITDADAHVFLGNNIFSENGDAAGEFNVEWVNGTAELVSFHAWNVFYHSGGGGGANLSGLTVNAQVASSEFTTDPGFTDAAGGDFSISSTSPAKATGYPGQFLGGNLGYLDIGAVQRQEPSGGGNANILRGSVVA